MMDGSASEVRPKIFLQTARRDGRWVEEADRRAYINTRSVKFNLNKLDGKGKKK